MVDKIMTDSTEIKDERLLKTISLGEKIITYEEPKLDFEATLKFKLPTLKQRDMAEALYSKTFHKLLRDDDHMTTKELLDSAKRRALWTDKDEERTVNVDSEIIEAKKKYENETNTKKKAKINKDLIEKREEKFRLALRVGQLTATGIENLAERERTIYMLLSCVLLVDENGNESPLYSSKEKVEGETNLEKLEKILLDGRAFWAGEGLTDFLHLDG